MEHINFRRCLSVSVASGSDCSVGALTTNYKLCSEEDFVEILENHPLDGRFA